MHALLGGALARCVQHSLEVCVQKRAHLENQKSQVEAKRKDVKAQQKAGSSSDVHHCVHVDDVLKVLLALLLQRLTILKDRPHVLCMPAPLN